jgi:hypothetical protein
MTDRLCDELPLVVWFRFDYPQPRLVRNQDKARRLIERGVWVRAYVPNGTSVGPDVDRARRAVAPLNIGAHDG